MQKERIIMGMTIRVEILDKDVEEGIFEEIFSFFSDIDQKFSTFKPDSEISKINDGSILSHQYSEEMKEVLELAEKTKVETSGHFDIKNPRGLIDPSGIVKGWAIKHATRILLKEGYEDFYIDAGGDIEAHGRMWKVGIRSPFEFGKIIKVLEVSGCGIATSGNYVHKDHIYNPVTQSFESDIVSLTVIGKDVLEADRFATAAFAMGALGIDFIESKPGLEGYMIDKEGIATMTSGFDNYLLKNNYA
jgi:thiamine biosynthesis lipoprotein